MSTTPQGPGWWQASDGAWYPPPAPGSARPSTPPTLPLAPNPPPPGSPPPWGGPPPPWVGAPVPPTGPPEIGETLSYAWKKIQAQATPLLLTSLACFAVLAGLMVLGYIGLVVSAIASDPSECVRFSSATGQCLERTGGDPSWGFVWVALALLVAVLGAQLVVDAVMIRLGLLVTAGEALTARRVLSSRHFGSYLVASVCLALLTLGGLVLCIVPGLAVLAFGRFYGYFIFDKGQGPIEAISSSFSFVRAHLGQALLFLLVMVGLFYAGQAACYVGLIAVLPFNALATAYFYRRHDGQSIAA